MEMLRRILQPGRVLPGLLAILVASLYLLGQPRTAAACWNNVLTECFAMDGPDWPVGSWAEWSNQTTRWGVQNRYFNNSICPSDQHACWCAGRPFTNDPEFTPYPPNLDTYMTWGPVSLTGMTAAGVSFWLLNRSEAAHDSVFWGASLSPSLSPTNMMIAGSYSGDAEANWNLKNIDFARLRSPTGDTLSYLGQAQVWVFWRFRSDGNANPPDRIPLDFGAIVDNVSISRDNGGVDMQAQVASLWNLHGVPYENIVPGDTARAIFTWTTCEGGTGIYPPFRIMGLLDSDVILDTVISNATPGMTDTLGTDWWVFQPDSHHVRFVVDTMNTVVETDEGNNVARLNYWVPPFHSITFEWLTPGDSAAYGDQSVMLRWRAIPDPLAPATIDLSASVDEGGCLGLPIPGGNDHLVTPGLDSLEWNLTGYNYGTTRYPFVRWHDAYHQDTCIFATSPVIRQILAAGDKKVEIPEHYYLSQNYPNPFNPSTELRYGIAQAGHVTLTVFDVLGREAATLVNGELTPGNYRLTFDGGDLPSGVYFYRLTTPEGVQTQKMMLMK